MISSLVIVFREMLEMVIVMGVLMAATHGLEGSRRWITAGALLGLMGAIFFGLFMAQLESSFDGEGEFIFNAAVLGTASLLIAWTVFWMSLHGRELSQRMQQLGSSVKHGNLPKTALMVVACTAVMREGAEAAFFLLGAAQGASRDGWSILVGGLMGGGSALVIGLIIYFGLVRVPVHRLFEVAGWLLMLLAAGMASEATWNLVAIEWLPPLVDPLWNSSTLLSQESLAGTFLHVLIGYNDHPSALQVIVFIVALSLMSLTYYRVQSNRRPEVPGS